MRLPRLLVLTDRTQTQGRPLLDVVAAAVRGGARAVVLREKDLPRSDRVRLATALALLLRDVDGTLIVASDATIAAHGVHLGRRDSWPAVRPPVVGRSCHSRAEAAAAHRQGCDYITLSPIFASASKPGYGPTLGPTALADTAVHAYALGGITASNADRCVAAGAAGVAVMGAIMGAADPEGTTRELCNALTAYPVAAKEPA